MYETVKKHTGLFRQEKIAAAAAAQGHPQWS